MSFKISRQRYAHDNCLYVEIAVGSKNMSDDILPIRYNKYGEGKNLVDPRDAVRLSKELFKRWNLDYADETKKLSIVGLASKDGKPVRAVFDFRSDAELKQAERWADNTFNSMPKCSYCNRCIGSKKPLEDAALPGKSFCQENCFANLYRNMFGKEAPTAKKPKRKI